MALRSTDLMIGDWISLFQGNCDSSPCNCKVNSISEYEIGIDGCDEYDYATLPLLFPIPLTPEILEKNGWEYNNYNNETEYEEEYYVDENGFDIHINVGKFEIRCIDGVNIKLNYVHELQHTLKLCGIDKEIVL